MKEVLLPSLGADMTEGTLIKWLKKEGDKLARGDKIAEIETDKTIVEMEAYHDGYLRKLVTPEGTVAPVGTVIAYVGEMDEPLPAGAHASAPPPATKEVADAPTPTPAPVAEKPAAPQAPPTPAPAPVPTTAPAPAPEPATLADTSDLRVSPMARSIARQRNIDLSKVEGTGPAGRITRDDVLRFKQTLVKPSFVSTEVKVSAKNVELDEKTETLSTMRQAIAKTTVKSKTEIPHFQVSVSIDITSAMEWRSGINEVLQSSGSKISVNDIVLKAIVGALIENPKWNATYLDDRLRYNSNINIGIAIALEAGLMVPAVLGAQKMSMVELSNAAKDLGKRARDNRLTQAELTEGTFSTSNLGMFDVDTFSAIIVPGQSGILSVGSVKPTPVVRDGQIVVRQILQAVLAADHRVCDGAEAGVLLSSFRSHIENPAKIFLT